MLCYGQNKPAGTMLVTTALHTDAAAAAAIYANKPDETPELKLQSTNGVSLFKSTPSISTRILANI